MPQTHKVTHTKTPVQKLRVWAYLAIVNVLPCIAIALGTRAVDWLAFAVLYLAAAFAVGIGLHRYFAHRSFKTSRTFQFILGILSCLTFTDPISFAGKHRIHHRHSDTQDDVHSPNDGFWYCWFGSMVDEGYTQEAVNTAARDWTKYPELMWMQKYFYVPGVLLGVLTFWIGGFSMFAIGFCLSRALIMHAASLVNYACHRFGSRRFATRDESRNNLWVAWLTFGEGWHNNHHHYPTSAKAGFYWWEFDPLYWTVRGLAAVGIVWQVKGVPDRVLERRLAND